MQGQFPGELFFLYSPQIFGFPYVVVLRFCSISSLMVLSLSPEFDGKVYFKQDGTNHLSLFWGQGYCLFNIYVDIHFLQAFPLIKDWTLLNLRYMYLQKKTFGRNINKTSKKKSVVVKLNIKLNVDFNTKYRNITESSVKAFQNLILHILQTIV